MEPSKEIWKDIPGYEGSYKVSSYGRVKSLKRTVKGKLNSNRIIQDKIISPSKDRKGYLRAYLTKSGITKTISVHQLVAMAFLGHKRCGMLLVVDHNDDDKVNNFYKNLRIITNVDNVRKNKNGVNSINTGVSWRKRSKKWISRITIDTKVHHLGSFDCEKQASEAYQAKLSEIKE